MPYEVLLTRDAERDLVGLYNYIAEHDALESANYLLGRIEAVTLELAELPERGNYPPELLELGIREYRERFFKPYRIIYRVIQKQGYVMVIADGRRDMKSLLERRLIAG